MSVQSVFGPAFTAVGKKTVVGDMGTLSAVRAALEVFASHGMTSTYQMYYVLLTFRLEIFTQSLLDENVFQVITDGITTDVLKFREGHLVKAQIAESGACGSWSNLVREFLSGIVRFSLRACI